MKFKKTIEIDSIGYEIRIYDDYEVEFSAIYGGTSLDTDSFGYAQAGTRELNCTKNPFKVLKTISRILIDYAHEHNVPFLQFVGFGETRQSVYEKMSHRICKQLNFTFVAKNGYFILVRPRA